VIQWYTEVLKKYAVFTGRARRAEYWSFWLVNFVIIVVLSVVGGFLGRAVGSFLVGIYSLAVLVPHLAVAVRRLHDTGKSGWWVLILLVPFVGWIALLILLVLEGQPGDNEYGPNPKSAAVLQTA
jgi:uncharacterized membrane protein YhaH (DUF805 family)